MIIEDLNGNQLTTLMLGEVERGDITEPIPIVLYNEKATDLNNVMVKADYSRINHRGLSLDTIESTFISLDMINAYDNLNVNIPAGGRLIIYIHFQPTWIAIPGVYQWSLLIKEFD